MNKKEYFYGPVPPIGARIRVHHPWLDDGLVGTVTNVEQLQPPNNPGLAGRIAQYGVHKVYLTNVMHWNHKHEWGPQPDTYSITLAESWSYENEIPEPAGERGEARREALIERNRIGKWNKK